MSSRGREKGCAPIGEEWKDKSLKRESKIQFKRLCKPEEEV